MYSSDSDDDIYGDIIKKRDKLLRYYEEKAKISLNDSLVLNEFGDKNNTITISSVSKRGKTKRKSVDASIPSKRGRKPGKLPKIASSTIVSKDITNKFDDSVDAFIDLTDCGLSLNSNNNSTRKSTERQTAKSLQNEVTDSDVILIDIDEESSTTNSIQNKRSNRRGKNTTRGDHSSLKSPRGHSTSRGRNATKSRGANRGRGTTKGRGKARNSSRSRVTRNFDFLSTITSSSSYVIPTYSIGNTDEYYDDLENVQIFSSPPKKGAISNNLHDKSFENEELSVKVCWQSINIHKFSIRRFQKIKVIYDFFSEKKNIPKNCLLFMYNDIILSPDDSPDSINYNVTKFIDGGVTSVHKNVETSVVKKSGVEIKFQCEKAKKPIIIYIEKDEKLSIAMIKCAEHLEMPLGKLRFEFDGDIITGLETLQNLEMEGGECIDVKIIA